MKERTTWFKHDSNWRNDPRIRAGMAVHGRDLYCRFFFIMELLREKRGFRLDSEEPFFWMVMTQELHFSLETQTKDFMSELTERFGLLKSDGRYYWEAEQHAELSSMVEQRQAAANARWKDKTPSPPDASRIRPHPVALRDNPEAIRMSAGVMRSTLSLILSSGSEEDRRKILEKNKVSDEERRTLRRLFKQFGLATVELYARLVATKFESDPAKYEGRAPLALLERFMLEDSAKGDLKVPPANTAKLPQRQVFTVSGSKNSRCSPNPYDGKTLGHATDSSVFPKSTPQPTQEEL